jgi:nucleoside-diphosphate-sugar epimerase
MKMLVTGAAGFIGANVIQELLSREHRVIALLRSAAPDRARHPSSLEIMQVDLRERGRLDLRGRNIDVVLHLAAATTGSRGEQFEDTVAGTANLLAATRDAAIHRVVGISSIAVLDYRAVRPFAVIDEETAIADDVGVGDYAAAKIQQEQLFREFAQEPDNSCVILRPGLVYDHARLTAGHAGVVKPHMAVLASHRGEVPTVEVHGLASAIANAAERPFDGCEVIHLVDDDLPSQREYIGGLRRRGLLQTTAVAAPWRVLQGLFWFAATVLVAAGMEDKLPEIVLPKAFSTRLKPFRFSNAKAKRLLGWAPGRQFA